MTNLNTLGALAIISIERRLVLAFVNINVNKHPYWCTEHIVNRGASPLRSCWINPFRSKLLSSPSQDFNLDQALDKVSYIGYGDDALDFLSPPSNQPEWNIEDDWNALAAASGSIPGPDVAYLSEWDDINDDERFMKYAEHIMAFHHKNEEDAILNGYGLPLRGPPVVQDDASKKSEEDQYVDDAIYTISNYLDYDDDMLGVNPSSWISDERQNREDEDMDELIYTIRCNKSPEQFLLSQGKVLPELTEEDKYSAAFLFERQEEVVDMVFTPKMTSFFETAVQKIFHQYCVEQDGEDATAMNRNALGKWMSNCLSYDLSTSQSSSQSKRVGPHDNTISTFLSRYCGENGAGQLTYSEFELLYLESAWVGYFNDVRKKKEVLFVDGKYHPVPTMKDSVLVKDRINTNQFLKDASLNIIWRDLEAHGIFSPAEQKRVQLMKEMDQQKQSEVIPVVSSDDMFMDECELFDGYEDGLFEKGGDTKRGKSSHELVEMTSDGVTPKRIRDGEFVFIDEESCIGCSQCATIAPTSFTMVEDTGRARTFEQRNTVETKDAVSSCPVNCMHMVSFDELKEMELSRDREGGFGGRMHHVPVHVAGRDSDANRKSSWYHYLKAKCACPQRGCYDCPKYAPGENPHFQLREQKAEHIRANEFKASGEADQFRKVAKL